MQQNLRHSKVGSTAWVLPEKTAKREGYTVCRAEDYLAVLVPSEKVEVGKWMKVKYQSVDSGFMLVD